MFVSKIIGPALNHQKWFEVAQTGTHALTGTLQPSRSLWHNAIPRPNISQKGQLKIYVWCLALGLIFAVAAIRKLILLACLISLHGHADASLNWLRILHSRSFTHLTLLSLMCPHVHL